MAALGWLCYSMDWNGTFSSEIFQWKLIFITLLGFFSDTPYFVSVYTVKFAKVELKHK